MNSTLGFIVPLAMFFYCALVCNGNPSYFVEKTSCRNDRICKQTILKSGHFLHVAMCQPFHDRSSCTHRTGRHFRTKLMSRYILVPAKKTSQELRMMSSSLSDCRSLLLNLNLNLNRCLCSCLLYTSPSPRDRQKSRMPSSA